METNEIIDSDLASAYHQISPKAFNLIWFSGILAVILAIFNGVQMLTGLTNIAREISNVSSMFSSQYGYYSFANMLYSISDFILNGIGIIYLLRFGLLAIKAQKQHYSSTDWTTMFKSIRDIVIVAALTLIVGTFFSFVYLVIGFIIN